MSNHKIRIFVLAALLISPAGCVTVRESTRPLPVDSVQTATEAKRLSENVRVALLLNAKQANLASDRPVKVYDMQTRQLLDEVRLGAETQISFQNRGLWLNGHPVPSARIRLVPAEGFLISVNRRHYRGQIEAAVNGKTGLVLVNYLPLEEYLLGVIPNEMATSSPEQALMAQAVAARTFALSRMSSRAQNQAYDLDSTVTSQVYGGVESEKDPSSQAVHQTEGLAAFYQGKFISAFYHSNCGGRTADVQDVWGSHAAYLKGTDCGFCDHGPHASWQFSMPKAEISAVLRAHKIAVEKIQQLELAGQDASGRVKNVQIHHSGGTETIKASVFRMLIGADKIRSTKFYFQDEGTSIAFNGKGWGHGVGLCQEGACGMAKNGFKYDEILKHYYPGIEIHRVGFK